MKRHFEYEILFLYIKKNRAKSVSVFCTIFSFDGASPKISGIEVKQEMNFFRLTK